MGWEIGIWLAGVGYVALAAILACSRRLSDRLLLLCGCVAAAFCVAGLARFADMWLTSDRSPSVSVRANLRRYAMAHWMYSDEFGKSPPVAKWEDAIGPYLARRTPAWYRFGLNPDGLQGEKGLFLFAPSHLQGSNILLRTESGLARIDGKFLAVDRDIRVIDNGRQASPDSSQPVFWREGKRVDESAIRQIPTPPNPKRIASRNLNVVGGIVLLLLLIATVRDKARRRVWGGILFGIGVCLLVLLTVAPFVTSSTLER